MKKSIVISKLIVFVLLSLIASTSFIEYSWDRYNKGVYLDKKGYIEKFCKKEYVEELCKYQNELLKSELGTNFTYSLTVTFLGLLIIIGGYETIIFLVDLKVKKLIPSADTLPIQHKSFLTIDEAGELSGLPVNFLKRAIKQDKLKVVKIGKSELLNKNELHKFIEERNYLGC